LNSAAKSEAPQVSSRIANGNSWLEAKMAESRFLDEERVADPNEQRWLHDKVGELERQLRLRTILLVGAVGLSAFLGSFVVASFHEYERPTVALAPAPPFDIPGWSPSVTWKQPSIDRSQAWAVGEERIEAIAAFQFEARSPQTPTEQLTTTGRDAERSEAVQPEELRQGKILGGGSEALVRDCSPIAPEAAFGDPLNQNGSRTAQPSERLRYAATDFVNLRAAPSNHAEVLTVVAQGDLVQRTWSDVGWLQVEYRDRPASSITGWVYSDHLRRVHAAGEPVRP
jgi:hypothetical protein